MVDEYRFVRFVDLKLFTENLAGAYELEIYELFMPELASVDDPV